MATAATSHVDPFFIEAFGRSIELLRKVFFTAKGQPFVVAGSGTLTWDMVGANLVEKGDNVLVINTGIFGDWFGECLEVYGATVTQLTCAFGDRPSLDAIRSALTATRFKLVTVTHVDTSTGVLSNIKDIASLVKEVSPDTLIALDGVCSVAAEEIRMDEWGLDAVLTASQKAVGVPPGLALIVVSQRALKVAQTRKTPIASYFGSFLKWLPIMQKYEARQASYFATPPVQLILALEASLKLLVEADLESRFAKHAEASQKIKSAVQKLGIKLVPVDPAIAANTLTAAYYPPGIAPADFLKAFTDSGIVIAGGLHPKHNTKYFRIGHMNVSATHANNGHLDQVIRALEKATAIKPAS